MNVKCEKKYYGWIGQARKKSKIKEKQMGKLNKGIENETLYNVETERRSSKPPLEI